MVLEHFTQNWETGAPFWSEVWKGSSLASIWWPGLGRAQPKKATWSICPVIPPLGRCPSEEAQKDIRFGCLASQVAGNSRKVGLRATAG